jgi:RNA polymerase sigma-70 factor (ECF subfamily)
MMTPVHTDALNTTGGGPNGSTVDGDDLGCRADALRLQKAQSLDRNTLGGIYDEFHPLLYSYIYRRVGDVEVARDLTADVFRRFLQAIANGNGPEEQLRAWLYRVAHNIVIDHYRRRENRPRQALVESLASNDGDPGEAAEHQIQCDAVRLAMAELTADQQDVITLKFLQGLTNSEIAQVTQKSIGAVKGLQHRALAALRRQLIPAAEEGST